jgi:hypothetical protein
VQFIKKKQRATVKPVASFFLFMSKPLCASETLPKPKAHKNQKRCKNSKKK